MPYRTSMPGPAGGGGRRSRAAWRAEAEKEPRDQAGRGREGVSVVIAPQIAGALLAPAALMVSYSIPLTGIT